MQAVPHTGAKPPRKSRVVYSFNERGCSLAPAAPTANYNLLVFNATQHLIYHRIIGF